ncbi:MAG: hypothetical protein AB7Q29_04475 [Vicinamibacterales bacterium]
MSATRYACSLTLLVCLTGAVPVRAQVIPPTPAAAASASPAAAIWEIELHGGLSHDVDSTSGTGALPETGTLLQGLASLTTFYFGSGTALYNQIRPGSPIVPLDPVLTGSGIMQASGLALGVRVQRRLTPRFAVEFSGDQLRNPWRLRPSAVAGLEATRASFSSGLQATLATSPLQSAVTSQTTIVDDTMGLRLLLLGSLVTNLKTTGRTIPYVVVGGGVAFHAGKKPSVNLLGSYRIDGGSYLIGRDNVAMRFEEDSSANVLVAGGGVKRVLSRHTGIRMDARLHFYKRSVRTLMEVFPERAVGSLNPNIPIVTVDSLQFSALAPLNGLAYSGPTFAASGVQTNVALTAGFYFRF